MSTLSAAVDRIIPASGRAAGRVGGRRRPLPRDVPGRPRLGARRRSTGSSPGSATGSPLRPAAEQDARLLALSDDPDAADEVAALVRVCFEGYYAARPGFRPAGLDAVGFDAVPPGVDARRAGAAADRSAARRCGAPTTRS